MTSAPQHPATWTSLSATAHELGEGSRLIDGVVHWVDLLSGEHHAWREETGAVLVRRLDVPLGFVEQTESGRLLGAAGTGIVDLTSGFELLADTGHDPSLFRVNDGTVAPDGSVWFGIMPYGSDAGFGSLWRWDAVSGLVDLGIDGIQTPNGPTFLTGTESVLIADSSGGRILRTTTRDPSGELEVFADLDGATPDGLHVDAEGRVWNAVWGAHRVDVYETSGRRLGSAPVPVAQPTSVLITPDGLVVVTSATVGLDEPAELDGHTIARPLVDVLEHLEP